METIPRTTTTFAGAWFALAAVAAAQSPPAALRPRVPQPPMATSLVPMVAEPAVASDEPATRTAPAPAVGRAAAREGRTPVPVPISDARWSRVHWDTDEQGTVWTRGRSYKASFGAEGATYFPIFGSDQPRHFPFAMSLGAATSDGQAIPLAPNGGAVRDGDRVVIDRGVIDEVYEIGVEGVEQTFVVGERPHGALNLFVSLETELERSETADGFEFANEYGAVRYSRAFAREQDGTKRALTTRLVDGGVEIEIGADYLATARFPLVVDPLVSTFDVDLFPTLAHYSPSVAYDATTDHYLFAYEETVTVTDGDVYTRLMDSTGTVIVSEGYVDFSTEDWYDPSVANLNAYDQFLVGGSAFIGPAAGGWMIRARTTGANFLSYTPKFNVGEGGNGTWSADIGGDPYPIAPAFYCVVWRKTVTLHTNYDIHARLVTNTGSLVGTGPLMIDNSAGTDDNQVSISKGNGETAWNVVWERGGSIRGAQVAWDGSSIPTPSFAITTGIVDSYPTVASPFTNGEYAVVWARDFGPDRDIYGALVAGGTVLSTAPLTFLEESGQLLEDQQWPQVDSDGQQFAVTYAETPPGPSSNFDVYVASFHVLGGWIGLSEGHVAVATTTTSEHPGSIASTRSTGGLSRRYALAYTLDGFSGGMSGDIRGALYDGLQGGPITSFCPGDGTGTACPCSNSGAAGRGCANSVNPSGALLVGTGNADLSADTVVLTASGMSATGSCLFFQGTGVAGGGSGAVFGDGLRCVSGTVIRLGLKTASDGSASYPTGADLDVSVQGAVPVGGASRYYQCWYRNSATFCTASTLNLTNGVRVVWLP